ncbi:MAG: bile acid:sodium symporter family protein [Euryarchaeota archaeon]|nr:bile acid:sodium symporter family protein [Euryarchaeota archaeon]
MDLNQAGQGALETSSLTDILLPIVLGIIMLGVGLGLRFSDFRLLFRQPRGVLAGLIGQLVLLPLAASLVVVLFVVAFGLEYPLALGLLLLAAVPGGATSNMLTWLARGDTALSVTLTAITSLGSFLFAPVIFWLTTNALYGSTEAIAIPFSAIVELSAAVVAGPVLLGMVLGHWFPRLVAVVDRPLRVFSILVLVVLISGIIAQNRAGFWGNVAATVPAALTLNLLAMGGGFLVARLFRLGIAQTRTAVIEVGFQNGTFAILLAVTQLDSTRAALMPGFYSLAMFLTGGLLAWVWAQRTATTDDVGAVGRTPTLTADAEP